MLFGATKILTLISVLMHAGLGCCAHHDHVSAPKMAAATQPAVAHQCRCHLHHHAPVVADVGSDSKDAPNDHNHVGCDDHCFWLTNPRVELPDDLGGIIPLFIDDDCNLAAVDSTSFASTLRGDPLPSAFADSLRAELQVWRL